MNETEITHTSTCVHCGMTVFDNQDLAKGGWWHKKEDGTYSDTCPVRPGGLVHWTNGKHVQIP